MWQFCQDQMVFTKLCLDGQDQKKRVECPSRMRGFLKLYVYVHVSVWVHACCMSSDSFELELQTVVKCLVWVLEKQTQVLCKSNACF